MLFLFYSFQNYYGNQTKRSPHMEDQDFRLRKELGKTPSLSIKKLSATPFLHASPDPSLDCRPHIEKKYLQ